ncbi:FAD-dependent monooxygenase [Herbiconiux sp. KACC 21604]|uniref:FAD-dependent monooxygenase n=1 Tax=unclassified Herbiconiux TaxID=2618217 RepID=UPI001492A682|nr:FAD-dependent monooxygenase [Herbiconiux sp. SALV-R1]QJU55322.1 NAD(P)-binding protein [Herbiconiux sp. SALV-R1]WPO86490.1 FAD-dependent monooxygenase [Herbiconiux sp. KACC 21604]
MSGTEATGITDAIDEVVVVGGGIGGLGAALALARSGVRVRLLERAPEFGEIGAGLQIGPNAVRSFDRLGVLDAIYRLAVFPQHARISDAITGKELTRIDFQEPMVERFGYPYLVLHRSDVHSVLLAACRAHPSIELENDRTLEEVVDEGDTMLVRCAGGIVYRARLVVGADGINSRVRRLITVDEPVFSGYTAYRGTIPIDRLPPEDRTDAVLLWIGPGIHLMQYPVRRGELYNQVAVFRSERYAQGREDWGTPEELSEQFAKACESVGVAVGRLGDARAYPNYDKDPIDSYVSGRAVLIGDAAHPMLQYLGQGACQALEDGLALAAALGGGVDEPADALRLYDEKRVAHTARCQRTARPWGESWHTTDATTLAYRDRYFAARRSDDYSDVAWLYDDALAWTEALRA